MDYVTACECGAWHLEVWKKSAPEERCRVPFKCRSWRHEGDCRLWKGAQDFSRIKEAIESLDHWSHICLTYGQFGRTLTAKVFRGAIDQWAKLRKRLIREFGDIKYIQTWEVHRSGWPHVHIAISNVDIFNLATDKPRVNFRKLIRDHAVPCNFGFIGWLERLKSKAAMAGYLVKLARELTGRGKDFQIPVNAPHHFRRLRASVRLLPPVLKDPDISGVLHFCRADGELLTSSRKSGEKVQKQAARHDAELRVPHPEVVAGSEAIVP